MYRAILQIKIIRIEFQIDLWISVHRSLKNNNKYLFKINFFTSTLPQNNK